ncbi:hypothetical protein G9464_15060 [Halostella sp. JP-L12]|uniref:DUF7504 family protein n=1 Tax=Halostella TaxID=1843185 RepID=UPI000EF81A88|nr:MULTISPECIES: hypothetical protein [Halostella]NHN48907.1 hypothetical protein [Halostella sp. JP-L12]
MHTEHGGGVPEGTTFSQELAALKREGSNILVVGTATDDAHVLACRRLLGQSQDDPRRRLFVFTDGHSACERLPENGCGPVRIVRQGDEAAFADRPDVSEAVVDSRMLSALGTEIIAGVNEFEDEVDGFDPAELRVCVDSVAPLLEEHPPENVFRLLHMVTSRIRQASGMGHFHLDVGKDSDAVHLLEPLFDAVVEVREQGGNVEHRWHLRDQEVSSGWIDL